MKNSKQWSVFCLVLATMLLAAVMMTTAVVDPFFHYHKPVDFLQYPLNNQRYQNDGIVKNFSYNGLITGTSLTENFKPSEMDALFGTDSVKVCFSGGTNQELFSHLQRAVTANPDLRVVVYGIDEWHLLSERDLIDASGEYPDYLYDDNPLNDVQYLLNKDVFCGNTLEVFSYTAGGHQTTSFDDYGSWPFPKEPVDILGGYKRPEQAQQTKVLTQEEEARIVDNLENGLVKLAQENPQIQFYCFFPPYSILNWDMHQREGTLAYQVQQFLVATQTLLEAENIHLYSFYTDYETITNLNNYKDIVHYSDKINSLMLQRMHAGDYRLTRENYQNHWEMVLDYYQSFDYESLFA